VRVVLAGSAFGRPPKPPSPTSGQPPTLITVQANGAVRGTNISTGALTCTGSGFSEGTSCYVYAKPGSTITATATIDRLLPAAWSWKINWEPYGGSQSSPCSPSQTACTASIMVPDLGGTVSNYIARPGGWTSAAMYVVACKTGETPYAGYPCPF